MSNDGSGDSEAPVAVGGVGGSGTRLVASLLQASGIHLGTDLNVANDTLWFTLLFKRAEVLAASDTAFDAACQVLTAALTGGQPLDPPLLAFIREHAAVDRPQHSSQWLLERAHTLAAAAAHPAHHQRWGWKEPNTHIVIERLWKRLPHLRYVHVVRHGVDMAFSSNQNQLQLWGPHVLGEDGPVTPARSLAYWCHIQQYMQRLLANNAERMYWLDYDALCREPEPVLDDLCRFLALDPGQCRSRYPEVRQQPARGATQLTDDAVSEDVAYVRSLGYEIPAA